MIRNRQKIMPCLSTERAKTSLFSNIVNDCVHMLLSTFVFMRQVQYSFSASVFFGVPLLFR